MQRCLLPAYHGLHVLQGLFHGQDVHLPAAIFAAFDGAFQIMAGRLNRQRIGDVLAGALVVLHPGRMRQHNPDRVPVHQKLYVHGVGVAGGDGHNQRLVHAVDLLATPAVGTTKVGVHRQPKTIDERCGVGKKIAAVQSERMSVRSKVPRKTGNARLEVLRCPLFADFPWIVHGFSTRTGGISKAYGGHALNLGRTEEDTREAMEHNRGLFMGAVGARDGNDIWPLVAMRQIHSAVVLQITSLPERPLHGDGLITDRPGLALAVRTADCLPVIIVDPNRRAVGVFHAGWRGTLARIVEKGVGEMRRAFGCDPGDLLAAIGPGIHRCCYEVAEDFRDKFAAQFAYADALFSEVFDSDPVRCKYPLLFMNMRAPGHGEPPCTLHLDLVEANHRQLCDAGMAAERIWVSDLCTACRTDLFFSHRKEKGVTGRMMNVMGIRGSLSA